MWAYGNQKEGGGGGAVLSFFVQYSLYQQKTPKKGLLKMEESECLYYRINEYKTNPKQLNKSKVSYG